MVAEKSGEIVFLVKTIKEGGYEANSLGYGITFRGATPEAVRGAVREVVKKHFAKSTPPALIRLHFVGEQRIITMMAE